MGAILRAIFGGLGLADLLKYAAKFALMISIFGIFQAFISLLLSYIPPVVLPKCMGYYAQVWGFIDGFRLFVSIVLYGFLFKFGISLISRFFD